MALSIRRSISLTLLISLLLIASCIGAVPAKQRESKTSAKFNQSYREDEEFAVNRSPLQTPLVNQKIVISKNKRRLMLYSADKIVRLYRVGLGTDPINDKVREGDRRTPEGEFYIFTRNEHSAYYLSLGLSYPNIEDARRGLRDGLITREQHDGIVAAIRKKGTPPQNTPLGGEIYIHGNGSQRDWTWGCVALDNKDMRELFDAVPTKTEVVIEH